jgi:hypothetical protein
MFTESERAMAWTCAEPNCGPGTSANKEKKIVSFEDKKLDKFGLI